MTTIATEAKPTTFSTITLEKVTEGAGPAKLGATFIYTYKAQTRDNALQRAAKRLEHDCKGENRLNWRVR